MVRRALLAVALLTAIACTSGSSSKPIDAKFVRFDGASANIADYRGKPVVMNFFSSSCQPCITEMPALEQVHRAVGDQVVFLGMDVQDTVAGGKAFIDTVGITWELGRDPDAAVLQGVVKGVGLPTTVILDAQGRIAYSHLGKLDDPKELTQILRDHHLIS